jgi:hypothetical protein
MKCYRCKSTEHTVAACPLPPPGGENGINTSGNNTSGNNTSGDAGSDDEDASHDADAVIPAQVYPYARVVISMNPGAASNDNAAAASNDNAAAASNDNAAVVELRAIRVPQHRETLVAAGAVPCGAVLLALPERFKTGRADAFSAEWPVVEFAVAPPGVDDPRAAELGLVSAAAAGKRWDGKIYVMPEVLRMDADVILGDRAAEALGLADMPQCYTRFASRIEFEEWGGSD